MPVANRNPVVSPRRRSQFLTTATGYGTVGVKNGIPFVEVKGGRIEVGRDSVEPPSEKRRLDGVSPHHWFKTGA
jgi:hypothetical protein